LLWFIYSGTDEYDIPQPFGDTIKRELNEILTASGIDVNAENFNPIRRVPVVISGDEGSVFIDAIFEEDQGGANLRAGAAAGGVVGGQAGVNAQLMALHSLVTQVRREVHEIKLTQASDRAWIQRTMGVVNTNMRRLEVSASVGRRWGAIQQGVGGNGAGNGNDETQVAVAGLQSLARSANASLSPCPRSLYDLWTEYIHGIGGRKPASQFSHGERGKVKHKYFRRNIVWKMVLKMVNSGLTSDAAIDRIYGVYGAQMSTTKIINAIIDDRKRGRLNPNINL
jgi:hypothetical protein